MIVKLENNGNGQYVYPKIMSLSSILHFIHLSPCRLLSYCPTSRASIQNGTWPLYRNRVSSHFGEIEYLLTLIGMGMTLVWLNLILGDSSSKKKKNTRKNRKYTISADALLYINIKECNEYSWLCLHGIFLIVITWMRLKPFEFTILKGKL